MKYFFTIFLAVLFLLIFSCAKTPKRGEEMPDFSQNDLPEESAQTSEVLDEGQAADVVPDDEGSPQEEIAETVITDEPFPEDEPVVAALPEPDESAAQTTPAEEAAPVEQPPAVEETPEIVQAPAEPPPPEPEQSEEQTQPPPRRPPLPPPALLGPAEERPSSQVRDGARVTAADPRPAQERQPSQDRQPTQERQPAQDRQSSQERQPAQDRQPSQERQPVQDRQPAQERQPSQDRQSAQERAPVQERQGAVERDGSQRRQDPSPRFEPPVVSALRDDSFPVRPGMALPPNEEIIFSRIVRATVGQIVEIPFRGTGWIYEGELASRRGIAYNSRRFDPEGQSFIFKAEEAGTYALKFYRQDFIRDYILNDYVQVIVGEAPATAGAGWFNPPVDRGRVAAQPRWPSTLDEAAIQRGGSGARPAAPARESAAPSGTGSAQRTPPAQGTAPPQGTTPAQRTPSAQGTAPAQGTGSPQGTTPSQGTAAPAQPPAASTAQGTAPSQGTTPAQRTTAPAQPPAASTAQGTTLPQGTAPVQGTAAPPQAAAGQPPIFNDGTPSPVSDIPPAAGDVSQIQERLSPEDLLKKAKETFDEGNVQAAIALLDQFREFYPSGGDELYWLYGQFYEAATPYRNILLSLDYYRRLVREYPQSSRLNDARRRIAYLERFYINIQ
jgi:hypothetical protein